jgi:hypothetical protein
VDHDGKSRGTVAGFVGRLSLAFDSSTLAQAAPRLLLSSGSLLSLTRAGGCRLGIALNPLLKTYLHLAERCCK